MANTFLIYLVSCIVLQEPKGLDMAGNLFHSISDEIPKKPMIVAESASYSVVILLGLAIVGPAPYAVCFQFFALLLLTVELLKPFFDMSL